VGGSVAVRNADPVLTFLVMVRVSLLPVGTEGWAALLLFTAVRRALGRCLSEAGHGLLRHGFQVVADSCCGTGELFAVLDCDEWEERTVGGTALELSVNAGGAYELVCPGGEWVDLASAVGGAVVDFDSGCCFVDVDAADEREPGDVCPGDRVDGQRCCVQGVCHRGQPCGEGVRW
jgi:hypothetical protein